jgi:hypothetical protein
MIQFDVEKERHKVTDGRSRVLIILHGELKFALV